MSRGFSGFPGGGNMQAMLQQAQKMQQQLQVEVEKAKADIAAFEAEGQAGGGLVKVTVNGACEMTKIEIKPEVIDPTDKEMLQDLIKVATNEATLKVRTFEKDRMAKATGGLPIPGLA